MAMRKIDEVSKGKYTAKVYRDAEWQEYRVKFYINGVHLTEADYHTDTKEDAVNTAVYEVARSANNEAKHV